MQPTSSYLALPGRPAPPGSVGHALEQYLGTRSPAAQVQLRHSRPFLAEFLTWLWPTLPPWSPGQESVEVWLAAVPLHLINDTPRLLDLMQDPELAVVLHREVSSLHAYRGRLNKFFRWHRQQRAQRRQVGPLPPAWAALDAALGPLIPPALRSLGKAPFRLLAGFAVHCGVAPTQLDTAFTAALYDWVVHDLDLADPPCYFRRAERFWQLLVKDGLVAEVSFYHPEPKDLFVLRDTDLPPAFQDLLADLERCMRSPDPDDWLCNNRHRDCPLADATIKTYLYYVRFYLGVLVRVLGLELGYLTPLDLFRDDHYLSWFVDFLFKHSGNERMRWHLQWLQQLCCLAQLYFPQRGHGVVDLADFRAYLSLQKGQLRARKPSFVPPEQIEHLLGQMDRIHRRWTCKKKPVSDRRLLALLRDAFFISFLLDNGNRSADLRTAQQDQNLDRRGDQCWAHFFTKNGEEIELLMTPDTLRRFTSYMEVRHRMGLDAPQILVTAQNQPMKQSLLYAAIRGWFAQLLNIHFTPHDFRRTLASYILNTIGDIDLALLMLGNCSHQVIAESYEVLSLEAAFDAWYQLLRAYATGDFASLPPSVQLFLEIAEAPGMDLRLLRIMQEIDPSLSPVALEKSA